MKNRWYRRDMAKDKKLEKLPKFKTRQEFDRFVETHDLSKYDIGAEIVLPEEERPKTIPISVKMEKDLLNDLKKLSRIMGPRYQTLMKFWLRERVLKEKKRLGIS